MNSKKIKNRELLTVNVITYNHAPYIEKCLDSILEQKTNFGFIVRIFDDCSTDGTTDICRKYAAKYPEKIKFFPSEKNLGITLNPLRAYQDITTPYYLYIEGDDYRVDKNGFQMQVDVLEKHPECAFCAAKTQTLFYSNGKIEESVLSLREGVYFKDDINKMFDTFFFIHLSARIVRTAYIDIDKKNPSRYLNDIKQLYLLLKKSPMYFIDTALSCYCVTGQGISTGQNFRKRTKELLEIVLDTDQFTNYTFSMILFRYYISVVQWYYSMEQEKYINLSNTQSNQKQLIRSARIKKIVKKIKHYIIPPMILGIFNLPRDTGRFIKKYFFKKGKSNA